jgi:hypothetical protein
LAISPLPGLGYGGLAGVDSLLSSSSFSGPCCVAGNVGGAEEGCWNGGGVLELFVAVVPPTLVLDLGAAVETVWLKEVANGEGEAESGWILRIKFIGALGLASARVKSPAVDVADGGNGC